MKEINSYIDRCLIDEYAIKDSPIGYYLDVDDLPKNEISNLLNLLMEHDTGVRDYVLHSMQEMIDERLEQVEMNERRYKIERLSNGDYNILPMRESA